MTVQYTWLLEDEEVYKKNTLVNGRQLQSVNGSLERFATNALERYAPITKCESVTADGREKSAR